MKKNIVSVGIPAYNEESNIKKLIYSLLDQKSNNFTIKEIIIVSDGSLDNTVPKIKEIKSNKILLLQNKKRSGLANSQNKIIKKFSGDFLILLNADVIPSSINFIDKILRPFEKNAKIMLIGPRLIPIKARSFFEIVINYSVDFKDSLAESWKGGDNLYLCRGGARAFRKEFAKGIVWKDSLSEDAYSYFLCKKLGYEFKYDKSAVVYFKSPDNFSDHLKQSSRFSGGPVIMYKYFNKDFVNAEYKIPIYLVIKSSLIFLFKNPLKFTLYTFITLIIRLNPHKSKYIKNRWEISKSTKHE